jgi:hypothetical protein
MAICCFFIATKAIAIWRSCIAKYLLAIWLYFIAKYTLAIWQQPIAKQTLVIWLYFIAKYTLAILVTSHCLNQSVRVSCFYGTRGSKLCFLTCFSYFSCYFLIIVFSQHFYSLISLRLSWLHRNQISRPISRTFGTLSWYVVHKPPCFWHSTRGFLDARRSWEPGSRLTTGEFSSFCLLLKVSGANVHWANANHTFLTYKNPPTDTFLRDICLAKLRSTARVWNPHGISKLVNKVDCWVLCALLKTIVWAFLATKSFAEGSSTYLCHMAYVSKSVSRDVISLSNCCPQRLRSAVDVTCNSQGQLLSISFSRSLGFSGA